MGRTTTQKRYGEDQQEGLILNKVDWQGENPYLWGKPNSSIMMKQLLGLLAAVLFVAAAGQAQLPLRNYIGKGKEAISKSLDQLDLKYDVEEAEWMDGEVTFTVYPNVKAEDKQENTAEFYLANDSCYFQQYNFKNDPFVLDNLRDIFSFRSDFSGCDYDSRLLEPNHRRGLILLAVNRRLPRKQKLGHTHHRRDLRLGTRRNGTSGKRKNGMTKQKRP
jgi:hypothetical protein